MIQLLVLLEVLRDFTQVLRIITLALGNCSGPVLRYTFVIISDILSLDFTPQFKVPFMTMMIMHFIIMILCEIYVVLASIFDKKRMAEVRGVGTTQEILNRKQRKIYDTTIVFILTSIFMPLMDESLKVFLNPKDVLDDGQVLLAQIFSGISMFFMLLLNPYLFIRGIRMNKQLQTLYNHNGEIVDYDVEYIPQSIKLQYVDYKNFAALSNLYNYNGSYHKLLVMIYKFMLILTFQFLTNPSSNLVGFICQYVFTFVQIAIFIHYVIRTQPYHDYRENRLMLISQVAVLVCSLFNFGLLWIEDGNNNTVQIIFSVIQFLVCLFSFGFYFFKMMIIKFSFLQSIMKSVLEEFEFTSINERGIFSFAGLSNRYSNYLYFNENYYEKDREVLLNVWQPFWLKLMQQDKDFRIKNNHIMKFVNVGPQSPPFLSNFNGTVQERFEENIRIIQKIGKEEYIKELEALRLKDNSYKSTILNCLNCLPGVDIYYNYSKKFLNLPPRKSYFCRVTAIYFPLTLVLQYDDEDLLKQSSISNPPLELKGEDLLKDIWEQNQNEEIIKQRRIRRILRALSGKTVSFDYKVDAKHMKFRETNGFQEDYYSDAVVTYSQGVFKYQALSSANVKLSTGEVIDIGTGFNCSIEFLEGVGIDNEGKKFNYCRKLILDNSFFGIISDQGEISKVLADIIEKNRPAWKDEVIKIETLYKQYRDDVVRECERRTETLSYDFNISIFAAPFRLFKDKRYLKNQLLAEKNKLFHTLMEDYPEEFEKLYQKIEFHRKNTFLSYLYFFFYDIWRKNKDLLIVQKNEELLNPDKKECIIYDHTKSIYDWKDIFTKKGLRARRGKGYFNDKLLKNFCYIVSKCPDKPTLFFEKSNTIIDCSILNNSTIKVEESKFFNTKENFQPKDQEQDIENQQRKIKENDIVCKNQSSVGFQLHNTVERSIKQNEEKQKFRQTLNQNQSTISIQQLNSAEKSIKQDDGQSLQMYNSQQINKMFTRSGMLQFKRYVSHPELLNQTIDGFKSLSNFNETINYY
ncbi:hypothetical protein ABPG72_005725 [Tetrahymena utriculariae]